MTNKRRRPPYRLPVEMEATYQTWAFRSGFIVTPARQKRAIVELVRAGLRGVTPLALAHENDPNDETAITRWAPAFSLLHKMGAIDKLEETRRGYAVYTLPEFTEGRPTVPHYEHHCKTCTCAEARR
jgi:hypothetical protein